METASSCPAFQYAAAGFPSQDRGGGCILIVLLVLFVGMLLFCCLGRQRPPARLHGAAAPPRDLRCGIPGSEAPHPDMSQDEMRRRSTETAVIAPVPNASTGISNSAGRVGSTPNMGLPTPDQVIGSRAGGAPFQSSAFAPSEISAEFYATFQPSSLSQMMPANWRPNGQNCGAVAPAQAGASPVNTNFDEFSRYAVVPSQVQKAETLRGTIRLAELTNTRNSKTLGEPSLLRNAVTPLSPIPIGSTAFPWGDSQSRQGYIAAATGRYPDDVGC